MMAFTDLHCHILPGLDDGPKDWAATWDMIETAVRSNVGQIVCTPHCRLSDPRLLERSQRIGELAEVLNRALAKRQVPLRVFPGAELLWEGNRYDPSVLRELTLAGTRYLLVEFPFGERLSRMEYAARCVEDAGFLPVLAHPERYGAVQRDPGCLAEWFGNGWVLQLDKGSVLGDFGASAFRTATWTLEHGLAHVVSSDAHNGESRTPSFQRLEKVLKERFSEGYAELLLQRNPGRIAKGIAVVK